jgi:ATP-dependent helicase/nuclease subunit B
VRAHGVTYGERATLLLQGLVAEAKKDDALAPVTIVVPTDAAGIAIRRSLAAGSHGPNATGRGIAGLYLLTVRRLAELLAAPVLAADDRRPATMPILAAAVRAILREAPGTFEPVADHPSTEQALVRVHAELSTCDAEALEMLAATDDRPAEVVRIHREVRDAIENGWYEEVDLLVEARRVVEGGSPVVDDLGRVLVHLPQELSLPETELLRALGQRCSIDVVAGLTGVEAADEPVHRTLARLGAALATDAASSPEPAHGSRVISVSDADEEVRSAVEEVLTAARRGIPFERIALLYPSHAPYARILHEHLTTADIPYNGTAVRPLADRVLGRWLLDLLDLPRSDFERAAVMRLLTEAPVRDGEGRRLPTRIWERLSRDAGVVRGRDGWLTQLDRYIDEQRAAAELEEARDEVRTWRVERLRADAQHATDLHAFLRGLFDDLDAATRLRCWHDLTTWAHAAITRYHGADRELERWPEPERIAARKVQAAIDGLSGLDAVDSRADLELLQRTLTLQLEQDLGRTGRLGQGVLVGPLRSALGVDLDVVVILGMAEGVMPTRPHEDPLLHDVERASIADQLPPRRTRTAEQHRHLLAALASATTDRILLFPRGDLRRSIRYSPSRWLLDTMEQLSGERREPTNADASASIVASFAGRLHRLAFPATTQLHAMASLEAHIRTGAAPETHDVLGGELQPGAELLRSRRRASFGRFDGNLGPAAALVPSPLSPGVRISASALESYLACPHAYLLQHVLRIEVIENPEELLRISALDRGSLVHEVLERWLREQLADPPQPDGTWSATARRRLHEITDEVCDAYRGRGVTGHSLFWAVDRARIVAEMEAFLDQDDQRRRRLRAVPEAVELPFGMDGEPAVELSIDEERTIRLRGKIDRIDRAGDGALLVTDYKTGKPDSYRKLTPEEPLAEGIRLQLPLYALAARQVLGEPEVPVEASYWFTSTVGGFEEIGYPVTDEVLTATRQALQVALDGMTAGRFPLRPEPPGWRMYVACDYCDPDGLGTTERYRRWERVRSDAELAEYLRLVEPDVAATLDDARPDEEAP